MPELSVEIVLGKELQSRFVLDRSERLKVLSFPWGRDCNCTEIELKRGLVSTWLDKKD